MSTTDAGKPVKIKCISDRRPWTDTRPLEKGEVAEVPPEVAKLLIERKFAKAVSANTPVGLPAAEGDAEGVEELLA